MQAAWYSVSSRMTARHLYSSISNVSNMSFQRIFMHTWNAVTVYFSLFLFQGKGFRPLYSPSLSLQTLDPLCSAVIEVRRRYVSMATRYDSHPFIFYLFSCPSISDCISCAFSNLPKHLCMSSWEINLLLSRLSRLILFMFIWMHVICCHSNHSLFSLECTQKSHLCCHKK